MNNNFNKVLKELQHTIYVEDPLPYFLDKVFTMSVVKRRYLLMSFYKDSRANRLMLLDPYWKEVNYEYLENKKEGRDLVWFEFIGKHIQIVN